MGFFSLGATLDLLNFELQLDSIHGFSLDFVSSFVFELQLDCMHMGFGTSECEMQLPWGFKMFPRVE
jgi:hypothetical protein